MPRDLYKEQAEENRASRVQPKDLYVEQKEGRLKAPPALKVIKPTFAERNPNLYGAYGAAKETAKSFVPFLQYVDEDERNKLTDILINPTEKNLMEGVSSDDPKGYYLQDLNRGIASDVNMLMGYMAGGPAIKSISKATGMWMKKNTPTFYKIFTTKIGQRSPSTVAQKIKQYRDKHGEAPSSDVVEGWWKEAAKKVGARPQPVVVSEPPPVEPTVVDRLVERIRKAEPVREQQEVLYTAERGKRAAMGKKAGEKLTGQARWRAETKALGGEFPKKGFEPFVLGPEDTDELFNMIPEKLPDFWHQRTAGRGLEKIFSGEVPQRGELAFLKQVYGDDLVEALLSKRTTFSKMKELGIEAINLPRAIMASFDLSAPLRQGIFLGSGHPIKFGKAFLKMFHQFASKKAFNEVNSALAQKKWYNLLVDRGLQITEVGGSLTAREEAFMGANLAEKIPVLGRGVAASNRAYTGFLNKLRVDVANDLVEKAARAGLDPENNHLLVKQIVEFVNAASGRGGLPKALENSAVLLNSVFFSPRLMSSRLKLLNPLYYTNPKLDPLVRKEALKSLFAFSGAIGTVLGLAKMGGADVGTDPRSANFGKIKIGNTRIDIMGGFQQYIRSAGQLISGKYISSTTGREYTLGEGYKPLTRLGIIGRQAESKLSPPASFAINLLRGHDIHGEKISVPKEIGSRFVPMVVQDIYDIAKDNPDLLPLSVLGMFGVGIQTYGPKKVYKPKFNKPKITGIK